MEKSKRSVHATFFALAKEMGISDTDSRKRFVWDYSDGMTGSLSDLYKNYPTIYNEMLSDMRNTVNVSRKELDKLRKRVIACVFGYLKLTGNNVNMAYAKIMICRSAKYNRFNDIPSSRLNNVYNYFLNSQKDFKNAEKVSAEELLKQTSLN